MKTTSENSEIKKIQAVRGMSDLLPNSSLLWRYIENSLGQLLNGFGYNEIRTPIVEKSGLFKRAVGEVTDIVEKEMYTFDDRNQELLALRPELTAGCVRAGIEHGLLHNQEQRLWYIGPAFRYERPQKGRYRQFHQFGAEVFGLVGPDIDAELILITFRLWRMLGLEKHISLELNSIGQPKERAIYRQALVQYLERYKSELDADCLRRLYVNPLRILDSKNSQVKALLSQAPKLFDYLGDESTTHFNQLCQLLDNFGIKYKINPRLVRGLDYYNRTVFEWVATQLGSQNTVCAGGRYDGLVQQLGGQSTPAVGFAVGIERLALLIEKFNPNLSDANVIDIYIVLQAEIVRASTIAQSIANQLRDIDITLRIMTHHGGGSFKKQFARASKLQAKLAIVVGEKEVMLNQVSIKNLRTGEQTLVDYHQVVSSCLIALGKIKGK